jgi:predicted Zn-ribbon and HTH transcriptional regulator|tara:strand:- start:2752 stop:2877 length:126 start_codon:yes stop_codon:yes gene_type:complete
MGNAKAVEKRKCRYCGHEWFPRKAGLPVKCVRCQKPYKKEE